MLLTVKLMVNRIGNIFLVEIECNLYEFSNLRRLSQNIKIYGAAINLPFCADFEILSVGRSRIYAIILLMDASHASLFCGRAE
jgi:hypothetical protein